MKICTNGHVFPGSHVEGQDKCPDCGADLSVAIRCQLCDEFIPEEEDRCWYCDTKVEHDV